VSTLLRPGISSVICGLLLVSTSAFSQNGERDACTASMLGRPRGIHVGASPLYIESPVSATISTGTIQVGTPTWLYSADSARRLSTSSHRGIFVEKSGAVKVIRFADESVGWSVATAIGPQQAEVFWTPSDPRVDPPALVASELRSARYGAGGWSVVDTIVRGERLYARSAAVYNDAEHGRAFFAIPGTKRVQSAARGGILLVERRADTLSSEWVMVGQSVFAPAMVALSAGPGSSPVLYFVGALRPGEPGQWGVYVTERPVGSAQWTAPRQLRRFGPDSTALAFLSMTTPSGDEHAIWLDSENSQRTSSRLSHLWRIRSDTTWHFEYVFPKRDSWTYLAAAAMSGRRGVAVLTNASGAPDLLGVDNTGSAWIHWLRPDSMVTETQYSIVKEGGNEFGLVFGRTIEQTLGAGTGKIPVSLRVNVRLNCGDR
jgi:hypothetical protein